MQFYFNTALERNVRGEKQYCPAAFLSSVTDSFSTVVFMFTKKCYSVQWDLSPDVCQ